MQVVQFMIKLLVTDLDGTLLPKGADVSAANIAAVQRAVAAGVTVSIATGRMYPAALPVAKSLGVDVPIVTYNGGLIRRVSGEVLFESTMEPELVAEVVDFCHSQGWYLQLYNDNQLYFAEYTEASRGYEAGQKVAGETVGWDGFKEHLNRVHKLVSITGSAEETAERVRIFTEHFGDRVAAVRSNPTYMEINRPGITKASGVRRLAEALGVSLDETIVLGDSYNDLPMMQVAGTSVAMGNAEPAVKDAATFVTGTCAEDGFAAAVEKYVLDANAKGE